MNHESGIKKVKPEKHFKPASIHNPNYSPGIISATLAFFGTLLGLDFIWMSYAILMKTPEQIEAELDPLSYQMALHLMIWMIPFSMFTMVFGLIFTYLTRKINPAKPRYWMFTGVACCITTVSIMTAYSLACYYMDFKNNVMAFGVVIFALVLSSYCGKMFLQLVQTRESINGLN